MVARVVGFRHPDEKHWLKLFQFDYRLARHRVIFWQSCDYAVGRDQAKLEAAFLDRFLWSDETQVDPTILDGVKLIATCHIEKVDRNGGVGTLERGEGNRKQVVKKISHVADVEGGDFTPAQMLHGLDNLLGQTEHAFRVQEERAAFVG